ncbi:MAG: GIY-YIG nuclease family protein [Patescibacteria group bacterium]
MARQFFVYMLTNKNNTVLYTGITNNLMRRVLEHKQKINPGFTSRYNVDKLIYFDVFNYPLDAIQREKQIKGWVRKKKEALVNSVNPKWEDLFEDLLDSPSFLL